MNTDNFAVIGRIFYLQNLVNPERFAGLEEEGEILDLKGRVAKARIIKVPTINGIKKAIMVPTYVKSLDGWRKKKPTDLVHPWRKA